MATSGGRTAQQLLDAVQSLVQIDSFDPDAYAERLAAELAGRVEAVSTLETRDDDLRTALTAIDTYVARCMRIQLDHVLASDSSVATPLRKVLAGTVTSYADDLGVLRQRVLSVAMRVDARRADDTADAVVAIARRVLDDRHGLYERVLGVARALATAAIPIARQAARDRNREDAVRLRWTAVRRDLELVAEDPARIIAARLTDRLKTLVVPEEPVEEAPELTRGELIEPY
jgi:hypothetical protein